MDPSALLRPGLLAGRVVALGGGTGFGPSLAALGAATAALEATLDEEDAERHARAAVAAHGAIDVLVHDLRPAFGAGGSAGMRAALDGAWVTVRAVANAAWIAGPREGTVVLVAPPPAPPGAHAAAVRGAAENMARTLSIEWSRYGIRTVAITPGAHTTDGELAALAAYLASPAGAYFSGCRLALGEVGGPSLASAPA